MTRYAVRTTRYAKRMAHGVLRMATPEVSACW